MKRKDNHPLKLYRKTNNKGFSLIELMVSIAILAILIMPLLDNFVTAARLNAKAKKVENETIFTENIVEDIKAKNVVDFTKMYNYPIDFGITDSVNEVKYKNGLNAADGYKFVNEAEKSTIKTAIIDSYGNTTYKYSLKQKTDKPYLFVKRNITYGNKTYDALITLDSSKYITTSPTGVKTGYNAFQMPILSEINTDKNVLALQSNETESAILTLYQNDLAYCSWYNAVHAGDVGFTPISNHSQIEIKDNLYKHMYINITGNSSEIEVIVSFNYSCPSIPSIGTVSSIVQNKKVTAPFGEIYLFYYPSANDELTIEKSSLLTDEFDVYVVKQGDVGSLPQSLITVPSGIHLYTNANDQNKLVRKEDAKNRIYDIKVQLYQSDSNMEYQPDTLCAEFCSTKEE